MISKRAVSPLIATILLVGFTIAIGAMVSSFLIKQAQENFKPDVIIKDSEFCDSVAIGYIYNSSSTSISWNASGTANLKFLSGLNITNKGSFSIVKVTINANGTQGSTTPIINYSQPPYTPSGSDPTRWLCSKDSECSGQSCISGTCATLLKEGIKPGTNSEVRFVYNNSTIDETVEFIPWIKDYTVKDKNVYIVCTGRSLKLNLYNVCKAATGNSYNNW